MIDPTHTDSVQWILEVNKSDIAYIVGLFDAYDEFAVVRTLDPARGHIELMISPRLRRRSRETGGASFRRNTPAYIEAISVLF